MVNSSENVTSVKTKFIQTHSGLAFNGLKQQKINIGDKDTETKRLAALKQIKYREKSKRRYRRIRGVL